MNILLVNPSQARTYGKLNPPMQIHMGLAYIAAVLVKSGNSVEIMDIDAECLSPWDFAAAIKAKRYDIAGFTVTSPTLSSALELAGVAKKESPATITVFGGIHATIKPRETLSFRCVDVVVKGEGEITFREIAESFKHKRDLSYVKGLAYKKNGIFTETPPRSLIENLDELPFPARDLFKKKAYTYPDALYRNTAPMITSRGCPGMCTYCNVRQIFGNVFRTRSARSVADEIEFLVKKMHVKEIHIWDDNFTTVRGRVFEIRDEIRKRNIRVKFAFPNGIRADFLNEDIMKALKDMGTYSMAVGVESGSQEVLNKARKGVKLRKVEEVFALAKKMKLETWAFFMIGLPGDDPRTIKQTIDFAKKLNPDVAKFHILKPYPGTEVYEYLRSRGFVLTEDYDQFGIHTPPVHRLENLFPFEMLKWQNKAYRQFYMRASQFAKQILRTKTLNRLAVNFRAGAGLLKMILSKGK